MRTRDEITTTKLRGGFYSPDALVDRCIERVAALTAGRRSLRVLEPSAGDGAFVRGVARHREFLRNVVTLVAIERLGSEATRCAEEIARHDVNGRVEVANAISWTHASDAGFDVAFGNPPFVRFQFVTDADKHAIRALEGRLGVSLAGVSNLWLPVLLSALHQLDVGGAFAFIVPAECFTGVSAGVLRRWLIVNTAALRFDLFPPGSFPGVLQEVVILSGQRRIPSESAQQCEIREHARGGTATSTMHLIPAVAQPWTRYLLGASEIAAFEEAANLDAVHTLGKVAKFEVAAVTGANDYFSVDGRTRDAFDLGVWSTPLLPRIRHAPGLRYLLTDHVLAEGAGAKTNLLDFSADRPDPTENPVAAEYLAGGARRDLPNRYKCRIRTPWYRIPSVRSGRVMMSKRSHLHPRVVLNDVGAVTTDTIYRGAMVGPFAGREADLVAGFHNSATLFSAEIEGRSFGGGVLELVPSEVARLIVPMPVQFGDELDRLDALARSASPSHALIDETDLLLAKTDLGFTPTLLDGLRRGRDSLQRRRLDRNASI